MSTFDSTKEKLKELLASITTGKLQLPEFQRDWVWDDAHIRSLLVSIARSFPVGAIMLLEKGGEVRFAERPLEGVSFLSGPVPVAETLILDGQQRLTSLTQVMVGVGPVKTRDDKKVPIDRYYYIDIGKAMEGTSNFVDEDSVVAVDADHKLRTNFGRDVVLDLSTPELQYTAMHYPFSLVMQSEESDKWEVGLPTHCQNNMARYQLYLAFRAKVLNAFRYYELPAIKLKKETPREGICLVFEKVNTGGVSLNAFELVTATYAADGFDLRKDWFGDKKVKALGRQGRLFADPLLKGIEATDFLQATSILHTYERRQADIAAGRDKKQATAISAKKETMLALPLAAYQQWADSVEAGFLEASKFLRSEQFYSKDLLPYRAQLVPLAALLARLRDDWRMAVINSKLQRWFWCGVFGELYGGASETRIANDFEDLTDWISGTGSEPRTIVDSGFQPSRLDTMRTRLSAAYKGLQVLLLREGAKDFYYKQTIQHIDKDEANLDIHHIFPRRWCEEHGIVPHRYNSVINKTPISAKANRSIGGKAPSVYLEQIQSHPQVAIAPTMMDAILSTHRIEPVLLRTDNFEQFIEARRRSLLDLIQQATGKELLPTAIVGEPEEEDESEDIVIDDTQGISSQEASNNESKIKEQGGELKGVRTARQQILRNFWAQLIERSKPKTQLLANRSATTDHWLSASIGRAGFNLTASLTEQRARVECYIRMGKESDEMNKATFRALFAQRQQIEASFGEPLDWQELPTRSGCRICKDLDGGWNSPENEWPDLQDRMIETMLRLEKALKAPIQALKI